MTTNKITITLTLFSLFVFANSNAQEEIKKVKITEITLLPSAFSESNPTGSIEDFYSLAPSSILLPSNFDGYETSDYTQNSGGFSTSILLGIKFSNKDGSAYKANPILRAGLTYTYAQNLSSFANNEVRTPYDTLISSSTGEKYTMDSVLITGYDMHYVTQQFKLDVSVLFRTNPEARWSLFIGLGAQFGASINAKTQTHKYEGFYISNSMVTEEIHFVQSQNQQYQTEEFINQNVLVFSTYVPLGIDFRVSNNNDLFKHVHLFYEMRPSLNVTYIPELRTLTNLAIQHGIGMKVQWN